MIVLSAFLLIIVLVWHFLPSAFALSNSAENKRSCDAFHVDTVIADAIFRKGTRDSFRQWDKNDYDLSVTRLQMPHADGGFGLTPNTIAQTSAKVAMASRFLGLVGSLTLDEQKLWLPNQMVHDPASTSWISRQNYFCPRTRCWWLCKEGHGKGQWKRFSQARSNS